MPLTQASTPELEIGGYLSPNLPGICSEFQVSRDYIVSKENLCGGLEQQAVVNTVAIPIFSVVLIPSLCSRK